MPLRAGSSKWGASWGGGSGSEDAVLPREVGFPAAVFTGWGGKLNSFVKGRMETRLFGESEQIYHAWNATVYTRLRQEKSLEHTSHLRSGA